MEEKIYTTKKNGMAVLLLSILLFVAAIPCIIWGGILLDQGRGIGALPLVLGIVWCVVGWIPFCGLKVLKPQEALVLTLFGEYKGTIREPGFYFVNPFCTAVNPAATTKLAQSGEVTAKTAPVAATNINAALNADMSKKISLKAMTLNNGRQKINDCLGNPIEIGIAVIW
ncbi:MAG: SPFH domain-containing protein, partial [Lachnospiraceae bacterium]